MNISDRTQETVNVLADFCKLGDRITTIGEELGWPSVSDSGDGEREMIELVVGLRNLLRHYVGVSTEMDAMPDLDTPTPPAMGNVAELPGQKAA